METFYVMFGLHMLYMAVICFLLGLILKKVADVRISIIKHSPAIESVETIKNENSARHSGSTKVEISKISCGVE